ncbi:hypothetical protein F751_6599 [Auxenochlorella protothecoides]|uniref:Uncharacterized protein n=1 Tax=Auxenochlorella protothecoides TaxID=3075 RepID=A0A087SPG4_AUXPR|nr:hypothetical protein F751_6599 [Auxenochlorella protothecoides]KFM27618.1 hypothetical protein F751_6599 [Auxenochlorella protothecoides]
MGWLAGDGRRHSNPNEQTVERTGHHGIVGAPEQHGVGCMCLAPSHPPPLFHPIPTA